LPNAYSVINPLRHDCRYPFKHLSGVGLAYKLASLLLEGTNHVPEDFLDLVALGTVADIVPQVDENRILTKHGLFRLNRTRRPGLRALIEVAGLNGRDISIGHIGFILGPRINAMGRIGSPEIALRLLLTDDDGEARDLAKILDTENRKRQRIEAQILNEAILISTAGKVGKGSGRSIQNFHLFEALLKCREHLLGFGGHECACGVTIEKGKIAQFRDAINELASHDMKEEDLLPKLDIDMEVPLGALKEDVLDELENLSPFGPENPRPVLSSSGLVVKDIPRLIGKSGFKLLVTDGKSTCEAVSFGRQEFQLPQIGSTVDLAYIPAVNTWQGIPSLQLELKDIK
jgi:single-stranded-DNA-specific exonuclease